MWDPRENKLSEGERSQGKGLNSGRRPLDELPWRPDTRCGLSSWPTLSIPVYKGAWVDALGPLGKGGPLPQIKNRGRSPIVGLIGGGVTKRT